MTACLDIYHGKKVLVTGHTGFKGSWLTTWLTKLGAEVIGVSVDIPTKPSNFAVSGMSQQIEDHRIDVRDAASVKEIVQLCQPDFVFHLAAQALVRSSYEHPLETLSVNAMGSANVLDALRSLDKLVSVVMITSDKAYDNVEWVWGYKETDRLGGKDIYSASKGMAELAIHAYIHSFFSSTDNNIRIATSRAGNVIGGGDWASDRIVPDCMKAWSNKLSVDIRNPHATRPWQHVLEPLSGYLALGAKLYHSTVQHGEAFNFGPSSNQNFSVGELINEMEQHWESVSWNNTSNSNETRYEAGLLKLNCDKALLELNWLPTLQFKETVKMTVEWYKTYYQNPEPSMHNFSIAQISDYTTRAVDRGLSWAQS